MSRHSAENGAPVRLTRAAAEKDQRDPHGNDGVAMVRAVERIIASRLTDALAIVKRACDGECKSPGKHTGCHAHEPYRVLATTVIPPGDSDA